MNLLYITFGNDPSIHLQAAFSIYSFLAQSKAVNSINIITDNENFYNHLSSDVKIIKVTKNELDEWKGKYDFFWRIKIKAIEKICNLYPNEPVIYLDTDTFLHADLLTIKNTLKKGMALMHENEGPLSEKKSKTEKLMWRQIAEKSFGNIMMLPTDCMWNAGVVGIPNTKNGMDCKLALAICDEMCNKNVTKRLIEQYALSITLEKNYSLIEANNEIAHYWSAKELWNEQIKIFFIEAYFCKWDCERIIAQIQIFDIAKTPVFQKAKSFNMRLKRIIDRLFPPQNLQYSYRKSQKFFP
jgi:hypothetical protein